MSAPVLGEIEAEPVKSIYESWSTIRQGNIELNKSIRTIQKPHAPVKAPDMQKTVNGTSIGCPVAVVVHPAVMGKIYAKINDSVGSTR